MNDLSGHMFCYSKLCVRLMYLKKKKKSMEECGNVAQNKHTTSLINYALHQTQHLHEAYRSIVLSLVMWNL